MGTRCQTRTTTRSWPRLIRLSGNIDQAMYGRFTEQLGQVPGEGSIVVAVTTLGGDPEVARTMGEDIRLMRAYQGREFLFLGKVAVYSARRDPDVLLSAGLPLPDPQDPHHGARADHHPHHQP